GGLMLGAFFMATDYVTSPNTKLGKVIFAVGCGLVTAVIRVYGSLPEGASFSILLMNILTPQIDRLVLSRPFGVQKEKKEAAK
ncbi:MAG: RnfABCDGE type electron transport complex subunit D, partial [Clostridia bacterium]|nr:RnfABCDGE type electron transport complex subunit D [Clostridia bacterium]